MTYAKDKFKDTDLATLIQDTQLASEYKYFKLKQDKTELKHNTYYKPHQWFKIGTKQV